MTLLAGWALMIGSIVMNRRGRRLMAQSTQVLQQAQTERLALEAVIRQLGYAVTMAWGNPQTLSVEVTLEGSDVPVISNTELTH